MWILRGTSSRVTNDWQKTFTYELFISKSYLLAYQIVLQFQSFFRLIALNVLQQLRQLFGLSMISSTNPHFFLQNGTKRTPVIFVRELPLGHFVYFTTIVWYYPGTKSRMEIDYSLKKYATFFYFLHLLHSIYSSLEVVGMISIL